MSMLEKREDVRGRALLVGLACDSAQDFDNSDEETMAELAELSAMHCHAAILGKSIYTGAIDLAEAVRLYEGE